jgi:predicted Fe-Mo cluster-binding NifX family protein
MRRVAIPLADNKLSEYFGQCSHYEIFEIANKTIQSSKVESHSIKEIEKIPDWVAQKGITDVITYKIDKRYIALFGNTKINLFVGVPMDTPETLIESYLNGTLKSDSQIINEITKK